MAAPQSVVAGPFLAGTEGNLGPSGAAAGSPCAQESASASIAGDGIHSADGAGEKAGARRRSIGARLSKPPSAAREWELA